MAIQVLPAIQGALHSSALPSREPRPSGEASSPAAPLGGGPQGEGGGAEEEAELVIANKGQPNQEERVAASTVDHVATATLGQLEVPTPSDISVDKLVTSGGSEQSGQPLLQPLPQPLQQPLQQPQATELGAGDSGSSHAATSEDAAPPTPEPHLTGGEEEAVEVKHGHPEVPERGGGRGGDESAQPCPLTASADPLPTEDTPTGEQEPETVISPTPSTGDYGNGDANSSSVVGGAGKSQQEKSVLIRLSNRVRDLEENMSLFTSYLDQLSTRWEERGGEGRGGEERGRRGEGRGGEGAWLCVCMCVWTDVQ